MDLRLPTSLRRQLFRVAALLESADDSFEHYRQEVARIGKEKLWRELTPSTQVIVANWAKLNMSEFRAKADKNHDYRCVWVREIEEVVADALARACQFYRIKTMRELQDYINQADANAGIEYVAGATDAESGVELDAELVLLGTFLARPDTTTLVGDFILEFSRPRAELI